MKKAWILMKILLCAGCLYYTLRDPHLQDKNISRDIVAKVDNTWKKLEKSSPDLAKDYQVAFKAQENFLEISHNNNMVHGIVGAAATLLLTNLILQFVYDPLVASRRRKLLARQPCG